MYIGLKAIEWEARILQVGEADKGAKRVYRDLKALVWGARLFLLYDNDVKRNWNTQDGPEFIEGGGHIQKAKWCMRKPNGIGF